MPMREQVGFVLSDVDGTQVKPYHPLPSPEVQEAAHELRRNGIPLLEVTARSHGLLSKLVGPLDLQDNLCVLDGGATVAHADSGEVVWSRWHSAETKCRVVSAIGPLCVRIGFDMESRRQEAAEVVAALEAGHTAAEGAPALFAIFEAHFDSRIIDALSAIPDLEPPRILAYDQNPAWRCIQVVPEGVDKQTGATQLLRLAGLSGQRGLAIGDGGNDIPLFRAVEPDGIKVAVVNPDTPEKLKGQADWLAPSVHDDGFVAALQHYGLV